MFPVHGKMGRDDDCSERKLKRDSGFHEISNKDVEAEAEAAEDIESEDDGKFKVRMDPKL